MPGMIALHDYKEKEMLPVSEIRGILEDFLAREKAENEAFREMVKRSFQAMNGIIMKQAEEIRLLTVDRSEGQERCRDGFAAWKKEICRSLSGTDPAAVLSKTYQYMNRVYGICWDQEAKDFHDQYGRAPKSTLETAYYLESVKGGAYVGLFQDCLEEQSRAEAAAVPAAPTAPAVKWPVENVEEMRALVTYIANVTNNKSRHGMAIYGSFFAYLDRHYSVDWEKLEYKYRIDHQLSRSVRICKISLLDSSPKVRRICIDTFNSFVYNKYEEIIRDLK